MNSRQVVHAAQAVAPVGTSKSDYAIAAVVVGVVIVIFLAIERQCAHWFLGPLALCGVLTGSDAVAWLRGRLDIFDPKSIIGLIWFHGAFLAPLLHIASGLQRAFMAAQVRDWPTWFGYMALLNVVAILAYKVLQHQIGTHTRATSRVWRVRRGRLQLSLCLAIGVSAIAAVVILVRFGRLFPASDGGFDATMRFTNLSWLMMLGDPLALLITIAVIWALASRRRSLATVSIVLVALLVAQFVLLGSRGSRSAVIVAIFVAAALCHYRLRRIPVTYVVIGLLMLGMGGYFYVFYKRFGTEGLAALRDAQYRQTLAHRAGITPVGVVLGDLSRADVQAFLLYRMIKVPGDYQLRFGSTYLAAAAGVIPRALWPSKPSERFGKVAAGTDLQYGQGKFQAGKFRSSLVYGLGGEALLNFGPLGVPVMYGLFGALVGWYRRKTAGLDPDDARWYLVPIITLTLIIAAFGDSDNMVFFLLKNGTVIIATIFFGSVRISRADRSPVRRISRRSDRVPSNRIGVGRT